MPAGRPFLKFSVGHYWPSANSGKIAFAMAKKSKNYIGAWAKHREVTQRELAEVADISPGYLSEIISGRKENLSISGLRAIAKRLDVTLDDLFRPPPR